MADVATATAIYLCAGGGKLSRPADLHAAILRYNDSDSNVWTVTAITDACRDRVNALPVSNLALARSTAATKPATSRNRKPVRTRRPRVAAAKATSHPSPRPPSCAHDLPPHVRSVGTQAHIHQHESANHCYGLPFHHGSTH